MKKTTSIILIILLILLIIILTMIMIVGIKGGTGIFDFNFGNTTLVKEETIDLKDIQNIEMNFVSEDVKVYVTDEDSLVVKQYSNKDIDEKDLFQYEKDKNTLKLNGRLRKFCIGFCYSNCYFEVYIPKNYLNDLYIHSTSGDIDLFDELSLKDLTLNTTSGDIEVLNKLNLDKISIKSVSGDIKTEVIEAHDGKIKTTSGDIEAKYLSGKYDIETISGEVEVEDFDGNFDISSTSGDINIDSFGIDNTSSIKTVSGDVDVILKNNYKCRVDATTTSGSEKIRSNNDSGVLLKIKTTSGDIRVR